MMMSFDEMGFCGDMNFFSAPLGDADMAVQPSEPEATVEDDYTDEEMDVDELERRMWKDKMRLKRLKEQSRGKEGIDMAKQRHLGMERMRERLPNQQPPYAIKGEVVSNFDFVRKRKPSNDLSMKMDQHIYTCEYLQCPYSDPRLGYCDRTSRDNHQLTCPYKSGASEFAGSDFHVNEVKPVIFPQTFAQSKPAGPTFNSVQPSFDISGLGVPEDGQKMISELMSIYDNNIQGNRNVNPSNNAVVTEGQNTLQPRAQHQQEYYHGQGAVMDGNLFEGSNMHDNNHLMFPREENQFDRFKIMNSPFENNSSGSNNNFSLMFESPFDLGSFDYKEDFQAAGVDTMPKHDSSVWF
ncbi:hypothetical protein CUMW_129850 [Citrus unshiu]|nr:hypothetical protein CUMW_129850 [Citrus unshiu]